MQGQALCSSDLAGFFTSCKINVSGKAFGLTNSADTVRSIALQEIGHALGLLHAEGAAAPSDVMYGTLQSPPNVQISVCDINAWATVMAWLLAGTLPQPPTASSVSCEGTSGGGGAVPSAASVGTDKGSYHDKETALITVTVTDASSNPVAGAAVTATITTANGRLLSGSTQTGSDGVATLTYRVNARRDGYGSYRVDAEACSGGVCVSGGPIYFIVTQ